MISFLLLIATAVCFAVAVLISATTFGGNFDAWLAGGLLAQALAWLLRVVEGLRAPAPPAS